MTTRSGPPSRPSPGRSPRRPSPRPARSSRRRGAVGALRGAARAAASPCSTGSCRRTGRCPAPAASASTPPSIERWRRPHGCAGSSWTAWPRSPSRPSARPGSDFLALDAATQERVLRSVEEAEPAFFAALVEHAYRGYYVRPEVHAAIGYATRPPQPLGHELAPLREELLQLQAAARRSGAAPRLDRLPSEHRAQAGLAAALDDYEYLYRLNKATMRTYAETDVRTLGRDCRAADLRRALAPGHDPGPGHRRAGCWHRSKYCPAETGVASRKASVIAPEYQGRGIGTRLVSEVLRDAHSRGLPVRPYAF